MVDEGLGGLAKRWLRSQAKELMARDRHERADAQVEENRTEHAIREKLGEEAVYAAVPGLRDWKERQEAARTAEEAEQERRHQEELASRPLAGFGIALTGDLEGSGSGQLPARVERVPDARWDPETDEEVVTGESLVVDLEPLDGAVPVVAGLALVAWRFAVPGYTGPGTYDLAEILPRREDEGYPVDHDGYCLALGGWDDPLYVDYWSAPATIEVGPDERSVVLRFTGQGAGIGPVQVVAQVNLPQHGVP